MTKVKMFPSPLLNRIRPTQSTFIFKRNAGGTPTDPIQKLFVEKIREYKQKSVGGEFVDPSPDIKKELAAEMAKLDKNYGGGPNVDMTAFPQFKFDEPKIDPIDNVKTAPGKQEKKKDEKKDDKKGGKK